MAIEPVMRRTRRGISSGSHTVSAPSSAASRRCSGCLAAAMMVPAPVKWRSAATLQQAEGAGAEHDHDVALGDAGARAACTAHAVGSTITAASSLRSSGTDELALVGDHERAPAAAGVGAEAGLQPGLEVAEGDALAVLMSPGRAAGHGGSMPRAHAAEHRLEHDASVTVVEVADHLVAGHERERDDRLEVPARRRRSWPGRCRRCRRSRGRTRTQPGPGQLGRVDVGQPQRPDWLPPPGHERAGHVAGGESAGACVRTAAPSSAPARALVPWRPDRQQRPRATGRLRPVLHEPAALAGEGGEAVSGFTATGKPTASSMGRSLVESA